MLKLPMTRNCTPSLTFCSSHLPRYATETAKPNLKHICDSALTFLIECGLKFKVSKIMIYPNLQATNALLAAIATACLIIAVLLNKPMMLPLSEGLQYTPGSHRRCFPVPADGPELVGSRTPRRTRKSNTGDGQAVMSTAGRFRKDLEPRLRTPKRATDRGCGGAFCSGRCRDG